MKPQIQVVLEGNGEQASQRVTITPNPDADAVTVKAASSTPYQRHLVQHSSRRLVINIE